MKKNSGCDAGVLFSAMVAGPEPGAAAAGGGRPRGGGVARGSRGAGVGRPAAGGGSCSPYAANSPMISANSCSTASIRSRACSKWRVTSSTGSSLRTRAPPLPAVAAAGGALTVPSGTRSIAGGANLAESTPPPER